MATSDIGICSLAVMELGGAPVNSFDDPGDVAKYLKLAYPTIRAGVIAAYQWECMKVQTELTRESVTPIGWRYQFLFPSDMIGAPVAVYWSDQPWVRATAGFEVRGRKIVSNYDRLWVEYSAIRPEPEWPAWFVDLMVAVVGSRIAFLLTDQQGTQDAWQARAYGTPSENGLGGLMGAAMSLDAQGSGNNPGISDTAFIDARFGGVYPGDWT